MEKDANGNALSSRKRRQISRMRRHHTQARWQSTAERNLAHACSDIARMVGALDLSHTVREEAAVLYRRAKDANLIRGRSVEAMSAASVYAACRCGGVIRTLEEVAQVAQCSVDDIQNGDRALNVELGLETSIVYPVSLIPKLASACELPSAVQARAVELAEIAVERGIANGCQPSGVAAACFYLAADEVGRYVTQMRLAEVAGTCTVTLRSIRNFGRCFHSLSHNYDRQLTTQIRELLRPLVESVINLGSISVNRVTTRYAKFSYPPLINPQFVPFTSRTRLQ